MDKEEEAGGLASEQGRAATAGGATPRAWCGGRRGMLATITGPA
jgi:hypothetical protein